MARAIVTHRSDPMGVINEAPAVSGLSNASALSGHSHFEGNPARTIAAGLRGSVTARFHVGPQQPVRNVMHRALLTQYFGMLSDIGASVSHPETKRGAPSRVVPVRDHRKRARDGFF